MTNYSLKCGFNVRAVMAGIPSRHHVWQRLWDNQGPMGRCGQLGD